MNRRILCRMAPLGALFFTLLTVSAGAQMQPLTPPTGAHVPRPNQLPTLPNVAPHPVPAPPAPPPMAAAAPTGEQLAQQQLLQLHKLFDEQERQQFLTQTALRDAQARAADWAEYAKPLYAAPETPAPKE
jgi:hypothetical protein